VPAFSKQLTGQAADDLLADVAAIVPEMSGVGNPSPDFQAVPSEPRTVDETLVEAVAEIPTTPTDDPTDPIAVNETPAEADAETLIAPTDIPWSAAPEDEAEFDEYSLELQTGMVRKRGAFHRALGRITRPGTLREP